MRFTIPLLLIDFYKAVHHDQYPKGLTKLTSYFTPRMSRIKEDQLVMFGLQAFIKTYLIEEFNEHFFKLPLGTVKKEYKRVLDNTLGKGSYNLEKIEKLHELGYLPLEIKAVSEGERIPMKVPMIEVTNTHPGFPWLVNTIESLMSAELWHTMVSANVGYQYRKIVNKYYSETVDDNVPPNMALGDFSFRGQESLQSATKSSAAFCLSFINTATVPAVIWLENMYKCNCETEDVIKGAISTEHSVMCSNYAIDGDERTFVKRLLTEIYPNHSFSMVSDSYDYWNMIDNILPSLRDDILNHNGCLLIRGDSGDPVNIVTETVFHLWEHFGGTINTKGYKVLNPHIKAIYGDSITIDRCKQIYQILKENGFACNNVSLGVGSFSMQCVEEDGVLKPFTRDTYGIAVKSTYGEVENSGFAIFKNPKTDTGNFKKSQKGLCVVYRDCDGEIKYSDGYTNMKMFGDYPLAEENFGNLLQTVFMDGELIREYSLQEIRNRLHQGEF